MNVHHVRRLVKGADGTNTINIYNKLAVQQELTAEDPAKLRARFEEQEEPSRVDSAMHAAAETSRLAAVPSQPPAPPHVEFEAAAHDDPSRTVASASAVDHTSQVRSHFEAQQSQDSQPARVLARTDIADIHGTLKTKLGTEYEPPDFNNGVESVVSESAVTAVPPSPVSPPSFKTESDAHSEVVRMTAADSATNLPSTIHIDAEQSQEQATVTCGEPNPPQEARIQSTV